MTVVDIELEEMMLPEDGTASNIQEEEGQNIEHQEFCTKTKGKKKQTKRKSAK